MKQRDPILDSPTAREVYQQALEGFVHTICRGLSPSDAKLLANSFREHDGVVVFSDRSGGISFELKVTFRQLMNYEEVMALIGVLGEKNGPVVPTWAGDPFVAAEIERKLRDG